MDDESELRKYAQSENDYLLSLLLRPKPRATGEDPQKLAERNCQATARSFGESDPLHAMALNTLAFVHLHKHRDAGIALGLALKSLEILRNSSRQEEMLSESKCLAVLARIRTGFTSSAAIQEIFQVPAGGLNPSARVRAAAESFSKTLAASVLEPPLKRYLLLIALRDIALELLQELNSAGESDLHRSLQDHLMDFMELYFGRRDKND